MERLPVKYVDDLDAWRFVICLVFGTLRYVDFIILYLGLLVYTCEVLTTDFAKKMDVKKVNCTETFSFAKAVSVSYFW